MDKVYIVWTCSKTMGGPSRWAVYSNKTSAEAKSEELRLSDSEGKMEFWVEEVRVND